MKTKTPTTKSSHINPNCKNSVLCKPHGESGPVEYYKDNLDAVNNWLRDAAKFHETTTKESK